MGWGIIITAAGLGAALWSGNGLWLIACLLGLVMIRWAR